MYSKINSKSRVYFNTEIKHMVKKDKCEFCNSKDNLEVHHKEPLSVTTKKVIEQYKDIKDISALTHIVNSKSIQKGFLTLCSECHLELHKENDDFNKLMYDTRAMNRLKREKKHLVEVENKLKQMYDDNVVFLSREDREPFIEFINYREDGKLRKSIDKLNNYFEQSGLKYRIEQFSTSRVIDGKKKNFNSAWRIAKLD